ncbi:MAG TPA: hypothetical protein VM686_40905 [Polyangiaceae bacterium]|jgi:hypothetical protein|nr:hypothetical protein [Polyangiaceae bacterium]
MRLVLSLLLLTVGCGAAEAEPKAFVRKPVALPDADSAEPFFLSQTMLYQDIGSKTLAPDAVPFAPRYVLWSDGAEKERWLVLPPGGVIDSSDMDHWVFPVGTMLFKQFSLDGRRLETRLIQRTGTGRFDYWMGAFVWDEDETDAMFTPDGQADVLGSEHDAPKVKQCGTCHNGEPGRILGFSALQVEGDSVLGEQAFSDVPAQYEPPGDEVAAEALGYLHVNCGNCHNQNGSSWPDTDMVLRLGVDEVEVADSELYRTTVDQVMTSFDGEGLELRIAPGDPDRSGVLYRMSRRDPDDGMPPIASEIVHDEGALAVRAWIEQLE